MNVLFTVCGRAGSKGFQNKNLKELRQVPLLYYTLAAIRLYRDAHPDDRVSVALNTDSGELIGQAQRQTIVPGISVVERKAELAGDTTPKVDVIKDTYLALRQEKRIDVVVDLDITSPMRRVVDIEQVLAEYQSSESYDLVYSVVHARRSPYFNMVEKKQSGYYEKICRSAYTARQQAPAAYELNASIYAYRPRFLESKIQKTILDYRCGIAVMPDYLVLDIDSEEDFLMMEHLHPYYCRQDAALAAVYQTAAGE